MNDNKIYILILILFPYLYLFPLTFQFIEMGNDFELLYYSYKKYIYEFLLVGHFPLWSPSESLGYSLIFNPFAQYFYPLSWILYLISYLIGDISKHLYLLYTIFGISIYNIGQYLWLKSLKIDIKYCLLSTLIICIGLKINEILRFPNAIHAFCWFPWILYGINLSIKNTNNIKSFLIIFLSTLLILTAGYPYYILYALIFFPFYIIFVSLPVVRQFLNLEYNFYNYIKSLIIIVTAPILAFIIVYPWFEGIKDIMEITRDRNINDINFSYIISSNILDQIGSWIFPPVSFAESNYYFGSITTIILLLYFINFTQEKVKNKIEIAIICYFFLFIIANYQFAASQNSFLFKFIWEKIDLIKNFRAFARINILLLPLFGLVLSFALKKIIEKNLSINFYTTLFIITTIILIVQIYLVEFLNYENNYWDTWQKKRLDAAAEKFNFFSFIFESYNNYLYSFMLIISSSLLLIFKKFEIKNKLNFLILILAISELFILSNLQWSIPYQYYDANGYNKLNKDPIKALQNSFQSKRVSTEVKGNTYFRSDRRFNINYFDNFGIDYHTKIYDSYLKRNGEFKDDLDKETIKKIKLVWGFNEINKKVFFSKKINQINLIEFADEIIKYQDNFNGVIQVNLDEYDGDTISIIYNSKSNGYISFMDNWAPGWSVTVNNQYKPIEKTLNTYKAVKIEKGFNSIIFKYDPWKK